jgi:hypothetical protein
MENNSEKAIGVKVKKLWQNLPAVLKTLVICIALISFFIYMVLENLCGSSKDLFGVSQNHQTLEDMTGLPITLN